MYPIFDIKDKKDYFDEAVNFFWKHWGSISNYHFYKKCIEHSCKTENDVPGFFIVMDNNKIIGSYALLRSDLNSRQDLTPWFACLYVEPEYRGKNIGSLLQTNAIQQVQEKGYRKLFLGTELTEYYERTNWKYIGNGYLLNDEISRIYEQEV